MERKSNSPKNRTFSKERPASRGGKERSFSSKNKSSRKFDNDSPRRERKFTDKENGEERTGRPTRGFSKDRSFSKEGRGFSKDRKFNDRNDRNDRPKRSFSKDRSFGDRPKRSFNKPDQRNFTEEEPKKRRDVTAESAILTEIVEKRRREGRQAPQKQKIRSLEFEEQYSHIRLNKYIANAGICSRREADTLIVAGAITVNGEVVTELGYKVAPTDEVRFGDKVLQREKAVYILLNKPKDYITTMYDEFNRKHVMQLIKGACKERVYPVGRLDRDTTGLLLFTNDGEMTKKLTHPRSGVRKMYHVTLNKNLKQSDFQQILDGIELDDGIIAPDELAYVGNTKNEIGITIHSGKNRIVRRIFESLDYEVEKLDRVIFAGLTKKDLPRGEWRFLTESEINYLKMLS